MAQYRVIGVEDCERIAEELPSLGELGQIYVFGVWGLGFWGWGEHFLYWGFGQWHFVIGVLSRDRP